MTYDDVGDELLAGGVGLGLRAGDEAGDAGGEDAGEVAVDVGGEALEHSGVVEDLSVDDQYLLFRSHGGYGREEGR